ncbi:MAG: hypothetical protein SNH13_06595 [Rikenellaceae bacterium]
MKRFIIRTIQYAVVAFFVLVLLFVVSKYLIQKVPLEIEPQRHIVVIGDSYPEGSVDDSIFTSAINLSRSGRGVPYSYMMLRDVIEQNPHIDTVLQSFHVGYTSRVYDDFIIYNEDYFRIHLPSSILRATYYDMMPMVDVPNFFYHALRAPFSIANLKLILSYFNGKSGDVRSKGYGGFLPLTRDALEESIKRKEYTTPGGADIDTTSLSFEYLNRMSDYLESKGVKLILFNFPKHKIDRYSDRRGYDSLMAKYIPHIEYFDFSDFPLADSCYSDIGHVNYRGAKIFSEYLQENGLNNYKGNKYNAK